MFLLFVKVLFLSISAVFLLFSSHSEVRSFTMLMDMVGKSCIYLFNSYVDYLSLFLKLALHAVLKLIFG